MNYLKKLGILIMLSGFPIGYFLNGIIYWLMVGIGFTLIIILATLDIKFDYASQGETEQ